MVDRQDIANLILEQSDAPLILQRVQDRLQEEQRKREEFYETMDEDTKAEFIQGEIVFHYPVMKRHNEATKRIMTLLDTYVEGADLGFVGVEKILTVFSRNDYEPEVCFFNKKKAKAFQPEQMKFPVPDFVVEVLSKSKKALERDRKLKFDDYERHGVSEYWMVDPNEQTVEQYVLKKGRYELVLKSGEGHITSRAVKGFTIPIPAIFDKETHRAALRELLG